MTTALAEQRAVVAKVFEDRARKAKVRKLVRQLLIDEMKPEAVRMQSLAAWEDLAERAGCKAPSKTSREMVIDIMERLG